MVTRLFRLIVSITMIGLHLSCRPQAIVSNERIVNVDTIPLLRGLFEIKLVENGIECFFQKSTLLNILDSTLKDMEQQDTTSMLPGSNCRNINATFEIKNIIASKNVYEIINIKKAQELNMLNLNEFRLILNESIELRLHYELIEIICFMASKGKMSAMEDGTFVDMLIKKQKRITTPFDGRSSIGYYTPSGKEICECSIENYQFK